MRPSAIGGRFLSVIEPIVADNRSDTQAVVAQKSCAASGLGGAVLGRVAPLAHGVFVAPEGKREIAAWCREAFETLDGDETFYAIKQRA